MSYKIIELNSDNEFKNILQMSKKSCVIVDFYGTFCPPCRKLGPILEDLVKKNGLNLCKINVEKCEETPNEYNVSGIPHIVCIVDSKVEKELVGFDESNLTALNSLIEYAKSKTNKFIGEGVSIGTKIDIIANTDNTPIPSEPPESSDTYEIMFRYTTKTFKRRFTGSNTIKQVKAYIRQEVGAGNIILFTPFPRKTYDDDSLTIQQTGLSKREVLSVDLK